MMRARRLCFVMLTMCITSVGCTADDTNSGWSFDTGGVSASGGDVTDGAPSTDAGADADVRDARGEPDAGSPRCAPPESRTSTLERCNGQLPERMVLGFDEKPRHRDFTSRYDYALGLGPTGCPRIGYADERGRTLHYGEWNGSEWEREQAAPDFTRPVHIEFDTAGRPWAAYVDDDRLHHATRDESERWQSREIIEVSELAGFEERSRVRGLEMAFDCSGEPVVAVAETNAFGDPRGLVYLERSDGEWRQSLVDQNGAFIAYVLYDYEPDWLVVAPQGAPHFFGVFSRMGEPQSIVHIERQGESPGQTSDWSHQEFVAGEGEQDLVGSTWPAFDGEEKPHILYADNDIEGVWHFRRTPSGWSRAPEPVIDDAHTNGPFLSNPTGELYFFYATLSDDGDGGELRYAKWDGNSWTSELAAQMPGIDPASSTDLRVAVNWQNNVAHVIAITMRYHSRSRTTSYEDVYFRGSVE